MDSILSSRLIKSDLKSKIMKWTSQDPKNKQAYQQAIQLYRENFGKNPKTEADAKLIMKTAKQMAKTGQKMDEDLFADIAQQEGAGQPQGQQEQQSSQTSQQSQQNNQQSSSGVDPNNPAELFKAIQALYKSGQVTHEQLDKAFRMVLGQGGQQNQQQAYQQPDQTQQSNDQQNQQKAAASFRRVLSGYYKDFNSDYHPGALEGRPKYRNVLSSRKSPGVRFSRCPPGKSRFSIGSRVVYKPFKLSGNVPSFVLQSNSLYAGKEGIIKSINSEIFNVEMPEDEEIISAYGYELHPVPQEDITSARGKIKDPMRVQVRDFIANIPSFERITGDTDPIELYKEPLAPDHICYLHTETFENGKAYTIEFHTSPGELFADVYVIRDYDNYDITNGGYHIEDIEDQTGFDFDKIQGFITKELASDPNKKDFSTDMRYKANKEQQEREPVEYTQNEFDFANASFDRWSTRVTAGLSLGKGMSLQDMAIVSGLARVLSSHDSVKRWEKTSDGRYRCPFCFWCYDEGELHINGDSKLATCPGCHGIFEFPLDGVKSGAEDDWKYEYGKKVAEGREKNYDPNSVDALEKEAEDFYYAKGTGAIKPRRRGIGSGVYDAYKKTLDTTDKLTHNPLGVVDDIAAMPFKLIDKLTGRGKKAKTSASYNIPNIHGIDVESIIKSSIYDEEDYEDEEFNSEDFSYVDAFIDDYAGELRGQVKAIRDGDLSYEEFYAWIGEQLRTGYPELKRSMTPEQIAEEVFEIWTPKPYPSHSSRQLGFTQPTL